MTILPYRERGYIRFFSDRAGETLFEIKMTGGSIIVWGHALRPDAFCRSGGRTIHYLC